MEDSAPRSDRISLGFLVALSQVAGLTSVVLAGVWLGHYHGGFAWDGTGKEFNLHPLCMVLGMVFLQGDAILVFRVFRSEPKRTAKLVHGVIHLFALIVALLGVAAVFDYHSVNKIPHLYSLHSWFGFATFLFFCVQWLMGLLFFMFPLASAWLRALYLPYHVFIGLLIQCLGIGVCLTGITEKVFFSIMSTYSQGAPEGVMANVLGVMLVCFGLILCYVVTREEYKRPPNPEEQALFYSGPRSHSPSKHLRDPTAPTLTRSPELPEKPE